VPRPPWSRLDNPPAIGRIGVAVGAAAADRARRARRNSAMSKHRRHLRALPVKHP
jgi:hypothetical protein